MTCDLTHGKSNLFVNSLQIIRVPGKHYLLNRSSISAEQPLLLLNVITDRSRLISTSVVPPDTSSWKSSGVRDDISSDGMTSWRPLLIARNSSSTQPNITLVAYNLKKNQTSYHNRKKVWYIKVTLSIASLKTKVTPWGNLSSHVLSFLLQGYSPISYCPLYSLVTPKKFA